MERFRCSKKIVTIAPKNSSLLVVMNHKIKTHYKNRVSLSAIRILLRINKKKAFRHDILVEDYSI